MDINCYTVLTNACIADILLKVAVRVCRGTLTDEECITKVAVAMNSINLGAK